MNGHVHVWTGSWTEFQYTVGVRFSFSAPLRDCPGSQCKGSSETSVQHFNDLFNYYHLHTNMNIFHKIISRNCCRVFSAYVLEFSIWKCHLAGENRTGCQMSVLSMEKESVLKISIFPGPWEWYLWL